MTQPAKAQEPSMEEILASIRRIIADEEAKPPAAEKPASAAFPAKPEKPAAAPAAKAPVMNDIPPSNIPAAKAAAAKAAAGSPHPQGRERDGQFLRMAVQVGLPTAFYGRPKPLFPSSSGRCRAQPISDAHRSVFCPTYPWSAR